MRPRGVPRLDNDINQVVWKTKRAGVVPLSPYDLVMAEAVNPLDAQACGGCLELGTDPPPL